MKRTVMFAETEHQLHVISEIGGRTVCACVLSGYTKVAAEEAARQLNRGGFQHHNTVTVLDTGRPFPGDSPPRNMFNIPTRTKLPGDASGGSR